MSIAEPPTQTLEYERQQPGYRSAPNWVVPLALIAACGWNCLRTAELDRRKVLFYFGLLLAAILTRHINVLLADATAMVG